MKLLVFSVVASLMFLMPQKVAIQFTSNLANIKCGESVTLKWRVDGAERIYISNIGTVKTQGEIQVKPSRSVNFILVAEGSYDVQSKSLMITVDPCSKGPDDYPDDDVFKEQLNVTRSVASVVNFLDQTQRILQDQMEFSVRSFSSNDGAFIFITKVSQREITDPDDIKNRINVRRISYRVEIRKSDQPKKLTYNIKTFIQYKKKLEETWRQENKDSIHRTEAEKLRAYLDRLP